MTILKGEVTTCLTTTARDEYKLFLKKLFIQLNSGRRERFLEEQKVLRPLPYKHIESCKRLSVRVGQGSTTSVNHNVYSVESRLIGETIEVQLFAEHLDLFYAQKCVDTLPRLRGENRHLINYRHMIDQLERKPGAFENYRYREEMFPGSYFRLAYDELKDRHTPQKAAKEYLEILRMAAMESETAVTAALYSLCGWQPITADAVKEILHANQAPVSATEVSITKVDLAITLDRNLEALDHRIRLLGRDYCPSRDETGIIIFDKKYALLLLMDVEVVEIQMIKFSGSPSFITANTFFAFERRGKISVLFDYMPHRTH